MPRLNFDIDEATLLKAYKIGSSTPTYAFPVLQPGTFSIFQQQMGHDFEESVAKVPY
jgi:hypothetical protein